jgi:hypothetical protein
MRAKTLEILRKDTSQEEKVAALVTLWNSIREIVVPWKLPGKLSLPFAA